MPQTVEAAYANADKKIGIIENGVFVPKTEFIAGQEAVLQLVIKGANSTGANRPPLDVVMVLDRSGSMTRRFTGIYDYTNPTRINVAKDSLNSFIDQADPGRDRIGLVSYSSGNGGLTIESGLTSDFAALKTRINNISANGGTSTGYGLRGANQVLDQGLRPNTVHAIVFATDGQQRNNEDVFNNGSLQHAKDAGYVIYTVGISHESVGNEELLGEPWTCPVDNSLVYTGAEYLQCMSRYTNGKYYLAEQPEDLSDIYRSIIQDELLNLSAGFEDYLNSSFLHNPSVLKITDLNDQEIGGEVSINGNKITADFGRFEEDEGRVIYIKVKIAGGDTGANWTTKADAEPDSQNRVIYRHPDTGAVAGETAFTPNPVIQVRLPHPATINGTVYHDLNRNCTKDPGETTLTQATVNLRQLSPSSCSYDQTKTPSGTGSYTFNNLGCFAVDHNGVSVANYRLTLTTTDPQYIESCGRAYNVTNVNENETMTVNLAMSKLSDPWFQSYVGSIFANGSISSKIPSTATSPNLITTSGSTVPGVVVGDPVNVGEGGLSSSGWRVRPQAGDANVPTLQVNELTSYLSRYADRTTYNGTPPTNSDATSDGAAIYFTTGNITLSGGGGSWQNINYPLIIVANGSVTIPASIANGDQAITLGPNGFLLITATRDINIESSIGATNNDSTTANLEGMFVAGRNMNANVGGTGDRLYDKRLNIAGTVVVGASEAGAYISNRTHEDNSLYPADYFIYNPKLLLNAPRILTDPIYDWQETSR
ncbi:VWA domain-containing protein [candidate division WWE3 bacterium]|nr:VWA domain-containing protein [candidate division WWE3 bacterium]